MLSYERRTLTARELKQEFGIPSPPESDWVFPKCGKDMTPRPGAVLTCDADKCVFWRMT